MYDRKNNKTLLEITIDDPTKHEVIDPLKDMMVTVDTTTVKKTKKKPKKKKASAFFLQSFLFLFMLFYILGNELVFSFNYNISVGIYKILFSLAGGFLLICIGNLFKSRKTSYILQLFFSLLISILYISQTVYYYVFSTPYVISSLGGASDAMEFFDIIINAVQSQWYIYSIYLAFIFILITLYPILFFKGNYLPKMKFIIIPITCIICTCSVALPIQLTSGIGSPRYLLINEYIPISSTKTFGVPTSMALNCIYTFVDPLPYVDVNAQTTADLDDTLTEETDVETEEITEEIIEEIIYLPQELDIDFDLEERNETFLEMNTFFSTREATIENEYTGMFEGMNLILITAEGFSDKLIDPELTPTLYMLQSEGFTFENFYTPIWGVSTSDGEFVATTGLLPQSGVWSYTEIADNYMPFAFGNQFNALDYSSYAFHNHTYTYYNRNLSYPTMGYDYYAKGNGLDVTDTWPESDLEMIDLATPMFVDDDQFHVYFLTVSGHLEYNFTGNMMAAKNKDAVADLEYSDAVRAYISCNLELEYALTSLIEQLEEAGQLDNTVIALSADHYPYGLSTEEYAELYGKDTLDETFELYENGFILWNSEMEEPVTVEKYCSSLDIAATLSNLFDLPYDSRLYIGQDILSDAPGLVMFLDRSYITDDYMYDANTGSITYLTDEEISEEEIEATSQEVSQLFRYASMIIEYDYYGYLFPEGFEY